MSIDQIAPEALKLSVKERALLAASLWESIEDPYLRLPDRNDDETITVALVRDEQLETGKVSPLDHAELMRRLRR